MINRIKNYGYSYKLLSIAKNRVVAQEMDTKKLGYLLLDDNQAIIYPEQLVLNISNDEYHGLLEFNNFDVIEIWSNGIIVRRYDDSTDDNYFFMTGACNSNCVMCPSPSVTRKIYNHVKLEEHINLATHIPSDTPHLTITGGEPFMYGMEIFDFIDFLRNKFINTEFLFLTNGRVFSIDKYFEAFINCVPKNSIVAIPVHGSSPKVHDEITMVPGSFEQTKSGIYRLLAKNIAVELRFVVNKLNIEDFDKLADLIIREFSEIEYVSVIAMEMTGNASVNIDKVWIPYKESFSKIKNSILKILKAGIDVKLYNFPLCTVENEFWMLCKKSISYEKVRFDDKCTACKFKEECSGVFLGTFNLEKDELEVIL